MSISGLKSKSTTLCWFTQTLLCISLLCLLVSPAVSHSAASEQQIALELQKHLGCQPIDLVQLENNTPLLASKDICLAIIYTKYDSTPLWVSSKGPSYKARIIFEYLQDSEKHGLNPLIYQVGEIRQLWNSKNATDLAKLDTLLTYNLVHYIHDISYGQLSPSVTNPQLFPEAGYRDFNPVFAIQQVRFANNIKDYLEQLPPQHVHYTSLKNALEKYRIIALQGGWPYLPEGLKIFPGNRDTRVAIVRERLKMTGELAQESNPPDPYRYDLELRDAVIKFQLRNGLKPDGVIGINTRGALNVTVDERIKTIRINLARWRWQSHDLGSKYVLVNIAGYNLKAYRDMGQEQALDIRVVVGKERHQTPVFSNIIRQIDINPYWTIPTSIAKNEELPKLRKDPGSLKQRNIRLYSSWNGNARELDSTSIDWNSVSPGQMAGYRLRQDPGPKNPLGRIKFLFPNRYDVYLHDTSSPQLFNYTNRDFSHGCIRVSDPRALAYFLLEDQHGDWNTERIDTAYDSNSRKVIQLSRPIPVHITYQTSWVDKDGTIHFNVDVYSRDKKLANALF
ncbi:L,D-transpeptidase family protein [Desulfosediminicola sp.]|uniref:L,D-transpeptidase family protein n=1 Tax=Desulfosediminicola sp. TaxID=2886825 RepID=UPI003AF265FD